MIPSEPIMMDGINGNSVEVLHKEGTISTGYCNRAFIELLKSWNKMHDPTTDAALDAGLVFAGD